MNHNAHYDYTKKMLEDAYCVDNKGKGIAKTTKIANKNDNPSSLKRAKLMCSVIVRLSLKYENVRNSR